MRKRKIRLKGTSNRKSINNAFSNALDEIEVTSTSKLQQKKQANHSDFHSDSNREVRRKRLQEDEEENNLSLPSENILKSKPSISRRRRQSTDQNPFQDVLTEDDVLNDNSKRRSIARSIEKESSNRSMYRNVDTSKDHNVQRKSMRTSQVMQLENIETESLTPNVENAVLESNATEIVQSSDESDIIVHDKRIKLKSRFMQRARKSVGSNVFADVLANDSANSHISTSDPNKENDIHKSSPRSSSSKRSVNRSRTKLDISSTSHEDSPIRRSLRSSLNAAKKQLDVSVQTKDNIEENSSSSSLDDNVLRRKKSVFLKPKSRILENFHKSSTNNLYEEILEKGGNISVEKRNVSTEDTRASLERDETVTRSQVRGSLAIEKNPQLKRDKTTSAEKSYDTSLMTSNVERDVSSENSNELLENRDLTNASKSISRKNVIAKTPEKEVSSNRKSARERTSKEHINTMSTVGSTSNNKIETHKIITDDVHDDIDVEQNDTDIEQDVSKFKRTSGSGKEVRLTRNRLRNRSETPTSTNTGIHEVISNSSNDGNREHDTSTSKRVSKSSPMETRLTRNSLRNRSETSKSTSKDMPKQSVNRIVDIEVDNVNADSEINIDDISEIISSTRISRFSVNNIGTHKNAILSTEMETVYDENADSRIQTLQRNSISTKIETGNKAVNRPSVSSLNRTNIKEGREITSRQKSLGKSQNYRNTSIKSSKDISLNAGKINSSKTLRKIDDFFKVKQASTTMDKQSNERAQMFDTEKMEKVKTELEKIKNREMAAMKMIVTDKKKSTLKAKNVKSVTRKQVVKKKPLTKVVDKAFLVDGKVYRAPRLPRPKHWATDRLYKFLWNRIEPKYKLATRLKSEKFIQELAKIVSFIERRKHYKNYQNELEILMKEMARLGIINTRNDFYHFCQDFLPYEFRVKVVPILLPGNKMNIPYEPEKLHTPLLDNN